MLFSLLGVSEFRLKILQEYTKEASVTPGTLKSYFPALNEEEEMIARRIFVFMMLSMCLFMLPGQASSAPYYEIAQEINNAFVAKKPSPLVSQKIKGLTVDQAYEIQTAVVELRENKGEVIMGYKAGGWSPQFQKRFGLKQPIWGTLFKSMLRWPGKIYLKGHVRMFIEPEIGFRFQEDITEPVHDIRTLKRAVAIVCPAIELSLSLKEGHSHEKPN